MQRAVLLLLTCTWMTAGAQAPQSIPALPPLPPDPPALPESPDEYRPPAAAAEATPKSDPGTSTAREHDQPMPKLHGAEPTDTVWARVLEARPVYVTERIAVEHWECETVPVTVYEPAYADYVVVDETPVVLGAILGGVIGNQFGRGDGRIASTLAGAMLGSAVAADAQRDRQRYGDYAGPGSYTEYHEFCEDVPAYREERRVVGYDVRYEYQGRVAWTRTRMHPGAWLRMRVEVSPDPL